MTKSKRVDGRTARALVTTADYLHAARTDGERHLATFVISLGRRERIPSKTIHFLRLAFQEFLAGNDIAVALGLSRRRGRRPLQPSEINRIARAVWGERYYGATYEEALKVVGARNGLVRNSVAAYYMRAKKEGGVPPNLSRSQNPTYPTDPIERQVFLGGLIRESQKRLGASPKRMRNAHSKGRNSVPSARKPKRRST